MNRSKTTVYWNDLTFLQKAEIISSPYFSKIMERYKLSLKTVIECLFVINPEMIVNDAGNKLSITFDCEKIENVFLTLLSLFIKNKEKEI